VRYPRYNIDPFESRSGQTKGYDIGIYCFFAKNAALRIQKKTDLLKIRIMCPSGATYLPVTVVASFLFCFVLFFVLFFCFFVVFFSC
jgi:hypothetical protein